MGIKWMIKKSVAKDLIKSVDAGNGKLEALKNEVIAILKKKENGELKKAMDFFDEVESKYTHLEKSLDGEWIEKAGLGVGTVKIWRGKKYKKVSANPSRWVRVFDKHDRGASSSMGKYIAQVKKCSSVEELYQFCMKQRSLFQDDNGVDLPIMDKLRAAIDEQSGKIERGETNKPAGKKDIEGKSNQAENKRDKRIGGVALWDGKLKAAIKTGDANKIKSVMADIEKEYNSVKENLKGDELDFAETEYKFRKRDADAALKNSKVLSNGKTVDEVREKYGIKVDKKENKPAEKNSADKNYIAGASDEKLKKQVSDAISKYGVIGNNLMNVLYNKDKELYNKLDKMGVSNAVQFINQTNADNNKESEAEKHQNRSDAMKGNKNAYKGGFEDTPIAKAVEKYASDKQIKSTVNKVSSDDFASTDPTRMFMNGTFHEDGYEIATDGHVLSMIKSDYPADDEGKIKATPKAIKHMDKTLKYLNDTLAERKQAFEKAKEKGTGSLDYRSAAERVAIAKGELENAQKSRDTGIIDAKFPNYKKVIPSLGNTSDLEPAKGYDDFNKILKVAKVAAAYNKAKKEKASVKVGDYNFDPNQLINAVAMAEKHGLKNVNFRLNSYNSANSPIEFSGDNGYVVIMPMGNDSGRTTFDAATGNVNGNMTTSGRYVADDIKDFLGADGNSNKEETEEDKLKAETKAEKESRTASQETKEKLYEDIPSGVTEQNYKKYIDMGTKLYTKWGYDMNDPRQQKQLKGQINDIVQQINNKDFDILESLENSSNIFTRTIWMMQTGGVSPDKAGVEKYFGKDATEKHNKELEEKKAIYEQKKAEDEKRRLTDKVRRTFDKEHINYGKLSSPEARETFINYLSSLPPNRQESALNRLSKDMIRYKKDGKEKVSFMLDYIIDQIDDGTSIDTIKASYRDVRSKPIVSFAQWYADSKIGVTKSVLFNDFDEIIEVYEDTDFEDESYSDYDASQPDLFNSTSYKVAEALDSVLDF